VFLGKLFQETLQRFEGGSVFDADFSQQSTAGAFVFQGMRLFPDFETGGLECSEQRLQQWLNDEKGRLSLLVIRRNEDDVL